MKELLLIPGPTPVSEDVLHALSRETISHVSDKFASIMVEALQKTRVVFGCESGFPFIIAGSGTLGMEMALVNILGENENLLVVSNGFFGDRFVEIGESIGAKVELVRAEPGDRVSIAEIERKIKEKKFSVLTLTHVDTSTGVLSNVEEVCSLVKQVSPETLIVVDGVCATGGVKEEFDKWQVDVMFTGSQKALAVPPGLTLLAFSAGAVEKRKALGKIHSYYSDILKWMPVMEDPHKYFATPAVNMVYALNASLDAILRQGLENYFEKHKVMSDKIRRAMMVMGFEVVAKHPSPTLTVFKYPEGIDDLSFRKSLAKKGVIVAAGLKELAGKCFRMGHMGTVTEDEILVALKRITETVEELGVKVNRGMVFEAFLSPAG